MKKKNLSEDLASLKVGTVIWAKRYNSIYEKEKIAPKHENGPFVIVGKNKKSLTCLMGTSKNHRKHLYETVLNASSYKTSYFVLDCMDYIDDERFIKLYDKFDKKQLKELLLSLKHQNIQHDINYSDLIDIGDIVSYKNNFYYVCSFEGNFVFLVPFSLNDINQDFDVNTLEFEKGKWVLKQAKIDLEFIVDNSKKLLIMKKYQKYVEYFFNRMMPQRGSVLEIEDNIYYIYGEESSDWLTYKIYDYKCENSENIIIASKLFSTYFENFKISKKDVNFKVIMLANDLEKEKIKLQKKSFSKNHKEVINPILSFGMTVTKKKGKQKYVVLRVFKNIVLIISDENIKNGLFIIEQVHKDDITFDKGAIALSNEEYFLLDNLAKQDHFYVDGVQKKYKI